MTYPQTQGTYNNTSDGLPTNDMGNTHSVTFVTHSVTFVTHPTTLMT